MEGIDICWIEEAHNLTQEQWEILNSTSGVTSTRALSVTAGAGSDTFRDITGKDLVIYTGSNLNSVGDVASYLGSAAGGSSGEGVFILGQDSGGRTVLYHALDASFTASTDIVEVADLGALTSPNAIQLADFVFI